MYKNNKLMIVLFSLLFIGSIAFSIVLSTNDDWQLDSTFGTVIYIVLKVIVSAGLLFVIYLKAVNNPKANNLTFLASTAVIQLTPLAIRIIYLSSKEAATTLWQIISIIFVILISGIFVGLYIFSEED